MEQDVEEVLRVGIVRNPASHAKLWPVTILLGGSKEVIPVQLADADIDPQALPVGRNDCIDLRRRRGAGAHDRERNLGEVLCIPITRLRDELPGA